MTPDEISEAELSAAEQTVRCTTFATDVLRRQLTQTAQLLKALPVMPAVASLVFCRPGGRVECVPVSAGVTVGRGEGCEVRFAERQEFSRRHFAVKPQEEEFIVEDLGSSNGTVVNGSGGKIQSRELRDGDFIQAGGVDFLFVKPEADFLLSALPEVPRAASLVFCRPGGKIECVALAGGVVVGRGEDCGIRFEGRQEFSRRHFEVRREDGSFFLEDLGSSNGTLVNGIPGKVQRHELRGGDFIQAGGVDFLFVQPPPAPPPAAE